MPLTRVSLRGGKPATYRKAILDGLYQAMRETFDVPEGDRFHDYLRARRARFQLRG